MRKLSTQEAEQAQKLFRDGETIKDLTTTFGVAYRTMRRALTEMGSNPLSEAEVRGQVLSQGWTARYGAELVEEIRRLYRTGNYSLAELGRRFDTSSVSIRRYLLGIYPNALSLFEYNQILSIRDGSMAKDLLTLGVDRVVRRKSHESSLGLYAFSKSSGIPMGVLSQLNTLCDLSPVTEKGNMGPGQIRNFRRSICTSAKSFLDLKSDYNYTWGEVFRVLLGPISGKDLPGVSKQTLVDAAAWARKAYASQIEEEILARYVNSNLSAHKIAQAMRLPAQTVKEVISGVHSIGQRLSPQQKTKVKKSIRAGQTMQKIALQQNLPIYQVIEVLKEFI